VGTGTTFTPVTMVDGVNEFYLVESDQNGCLSLPANANYYLIDISQMQASQDMAVCIGSEIILSAQGGEFYSWTASNQIISDLSSADVTAKVLLEEDFIVEISDLYGCKVVDTIVVTLLSPENCQVEVYNAFSPNGDNINDFWEIDGIEGFPENTVIIYNRWGDVLIDFTNYNNSDVIWDGTSRSGKEVPAGTYFYVIEVGGSQNQAGWVQLTK
jgi:gliding motility-associated-like protein